MALSTKAVLGILHDNLERRRSVLPLNKRALTRWADGLGIPEGGETIIYTGHMYQLVPTMRAMAALMAF